MLKNKRVDIKKTNELFDILERNWSQKRGLILVWLTELIAISLLNGKIKEFVLSWPYNVIVLAAIFLVTWVVWLLSTKRVLFRSKALVIIWLLLAICASVYFALSLFPEHFLGQINLPYVQIWGSILVAVMILALGAFFDNFIIPGKNLLIVFAVDNQSGKAASRIKMSIKLAKNNIINDDDKINLVILPFGILTDINRCERYIKKPYTRADAIIFATVVDDNDEYSFVNFTSRINGRRFSREERFSRIHNQALESQVRSKEWNFINSANDNCNRTITISRNLEEMLRMYIGSIYLMKHKFEEATIYTNAILPKGGINNPTDMLASRLFVFSYLSSAKELETQSQDIDGALSKLNYCLQRLPATGNDVGYNKAMARVMFYKNDLVSSKKYTRNFKNEQWGYELNMGFYAMFEGKVEMFVRHYRHLTEKYAPLNIEEIVFALDFLKKQRKQSDDRRYKTMLDVAISYLYLYKDIRIAKRKICRVQYDEFSADEVKELEKLKSKIVQKKETIKIKHHNYIKRK